jgi:hypothetical protein
LADGSSGVKIYATTKSNHVASFTVATFVLSWKNNTVNALIPCSLPTRVLMSGVWAPNANTIVTFLLKTTWPAKMTVDLVDIIDSDVANSQRTATFLIKENVLYEIVIEFVCYAPSPLSLVSLE